MNDLPDVPHIQIGALGAAALVKFSPDRLQSILAAGMQHYGKLALVVGDRISRRWLSLSENPFEDEISTIAANAGVPGVFLLNLSYEWTCTSSVTSDPFGIGNRMLRTLDWPMDGLGQNVVVATMEGAAGAYENITWPGFSGVVTAMAPDRFSAAINQPPMRHWSPYCSLDWVINRYRFFSCRAIPPVHLLRQVFDRCSNYEEAKITLTETPISMPAFFTLSGLEAGEGCIIEREENTAYIREAPGSVANHWVAGEVPGRFRGLDSRGRYRLMDVCRDNAANDFSWLKPPILNTTTRLAVVANARRRLLIVQGWEKSGPATEVFYRESSG